MLLAGRATTILIRIEDVLERQGRNEMVLKTMCRLCGFSWLLSWSFCCGWCLNVECAWWDQICSIWMIFYSFGLKDYMKRLNFKLNVRLFWKFGNFIFISHHYLGLLYIRDFSNCIDEIRFCLNMKTSLKSIQLILISRFVRR